LLLVVATGCGQPSINQPIAIQRKIKDSAIPHATDLETTDKLGVFVTSIFFEVKTKDIKDYSDGKIPFASIEKAAVEAP